VIIIIIMYFISRWQNAANYVVTENSLGKNTNKNKKQQLNASVNAMELTTVSISLKSAFAG